LHGGRDAVRREISKRAAQPLFECHHCRLFAQVSHPKIVHRPEPKRQRSVKTPGTENAGTRGGIAL
jgi:hypothetical protein